MSTSFGLEIPIANDTFTHTIDVGQILFVLGANGSGKSSLVSKLFRDHQRDAKRISAHRQTWFSSNTLNFTPLSRENLEQNIKSQDGRWDSRWKQVYADERAGAAIYDLIDADNMLARHISELVRGGDLDQAQRAAQKPSPIQTANALLQSANLPIEIAIRERQKIVASRRGGPEYSVAELSDGERSAFLIAADVLTAKEGTLLLIDEPERHLHRSIISPLLTQLFQRREDCAFVISTHEPMLPVDNRAAGTLLLRSCEYDGSHAKHWDLDYVESTLAIDDRLKSDILGGRRRIIFVEGRAGSLDKALYEVIFPEVSVVSKDNCRDVEHAVKGLRASGELHWVQAWGIVDNDGRPQADIIRLRNMGVHVLPYFSVEAIYYYPEIIRLVAARQSEVTNDDAQDTVVRSIDSAIEAVRAQREHFVHGVVQRRVRQNILSRLPKQEEIKNCAEWETSVSVSEIRQAEETTFDDLVQTKQFEELLRRYPLRESGAIKGIAAEIGLARQKYEAAVRKMLQEDTDARKLVRDMFADLSADIGSTT